MDFYSILREAHSGWRYIALLFLAIAIVKYVLGWVQNSQWRDLDRRIGLFTTIAVDIQLLLGLVLWALLAGQGLIGTIGPLVAMEHPTTMIIAIAVMHIGWARARKAATDSGRYRTAALTFIITVALVALGVARITGVL
jgi:hypothetical protein